MTDDHNIRGPGENGQTTLSRRSQLGLAGLAFAAAALPSGAEPGKPSSGSGRTEALGERFEITRTNIKKWPVGSPIQAVLDATTACESSTPSRRTMCSRLQ